MDINLSDFSTRKELEQFVERKYGNDISANYNSEVRIKGTQLELDSFLLSTKSTVYGVQCELITKTKESFTPKELRDNNFIQKYGKSKTSSKRKGRA